MQGVRPPGDVWIGIAGLDLVRDAHGHFQVLEDNVRTPSGYSYAAAARRALAAQLDVRARGRRRGRSTASPALLRVRARGRRARRRAHAAPRCSPTASDNAAYYEHEWAAEALGIPLLEPDDLAARDDIDVVYRRTERRPPRHAGRPACCSSRCARAASASSTRSAPGSPTTSSPTPTSRT